MSAAPLLDDLVARLPGAIRRGVAMPGRTGDAAPLPTGIAALDEVLGGGLPRGRLSEVVAHGSAGGTSLAARMAAQTTAQSRLVAWIDAADAFDPQSASALGVELDRLLWVRPPEIVTALTAAELLLTLGGFALVVLDAAAAATNGTLPDLGRAGGPRDVALDLAGRDQRSGRAGRHRTAAPQVWIRLARAADRAHGTLVVLRRAGDEGWGAGAAAAVRLELDPARILWDRAGGAPCLLEGLLARVAVKRNRGAAGERLVPIPLR